MCICTSFVPCFSLSLFASRCLYVAILSLILNVYVRLCFSLWICRYGCIITHFTYICTSLHPFIHVSQSPSFHLNQSLYQIPAIVSLIAFVRLFIRVSLPLSLWMSASMSSYIISCCMCIYVRLLIRGFHAQSFSLNHCLHESQAICACLVQCFSISLCMSL